MFEIINLTIAQIGGFSVVIIGLSSWLGKVWSGRILEKEKSLYIKELENIKSKYTLITEQYKIQLKKSEFFFQKQFDASLEFGKFFYEVLPKKQSALDEWEDVMRSIADDLEEHKIFIDKFISKYNVLFDVKTIDLLENTSYQVIRTNDDKDLHSINGSLDIDWEDNKWKYADVFIGNCKKHMKP